jgi:beta-mannosidase
MKRKVGLNKGWTLTFCDYGEGEKSGFADITSDETWIQAAVPGDVHVECEREGLIKDPFLGTNFNDCTWIEEKDWWYRVDFNPPDYSEDQKVFIEF